MQPKTLEIEGLEKDAIVTIYNSTTKGEVLIRGIVSNHVAPPWVVYMVTGEGFIGGLWYAIREDPFPFLGPDSGIIKIEKDGSVLYENSRIPVPYKAFDVLTYEGQDALNLFRWQCFGEGFGHPFEIENGIIEERKRQHLEYLNDFLEGVKSMKNYGLSLDDQIDSIEKTRDAGYMTKEEAEGIIKRL